MGKVEEIRNKLAEIEKMDSVDDLNSKAVRDSRNSFDIELNEPKHYSNDLEGELIQELDETLDAGRKLELVNAVKELRKIKKEQAKKEYMKSLAGEQKNNNLKIDEYKKQVEEIRSQRRENFEIAKENRQVLKIKKPDSKVYQIALEESRECLRIARAQNAKIKEFREKISELERQNEQIDLFLFGDYEEYIEDVQEQEQQNGVETEQAEENTDEQSQQEVEEQQVPKSEENETEKLKIEELDEPQNLKDVNQTVKTSTNTIAGIQMSAWGTKQARTQTSNHSNIFAGSSKEIQEDSDASISDIISKVKREYNMQNEGKRWKVDKILFHVMDGNEPCYTISLTDGEKEIEKMFMGEQYLKALKPAEARELVTKKNLRGVKKYYDAGLASVLETIDNCCNTSALADYEYMIKNEEHIFETSDEHSDKMLAIDYDFSGLSGKLKTKEGQANIKSLKKLAKASQFQNLASYEKQPNFLKRLLKKLTTKQIGSASAIKEEGKENTDNQNQQRTNTIKEKEVGPLTRKAVFKNFLAMHDEEGFDVNVFTEGLSKGEADMYKKLQSYEQIKKKTNPFKEGLARTAEKTNAKSEKLETEKACEQSSNAHEEQETSR